MVLREQIVQQLKPVAVEDSHCKVAVQKVKARTHCLPSPFPSPLQLFPSFLHPAELYAQPDLNPPFFFLTFFYQSDWNLTRS